MTVKRCVGRLYKKEGNSFTYIGRKSATGYERQGLASGIRTELEWCRKLSEDVDESAEAKVADETDAQRIT